MVQIINIKNDTTVAPTAIMRKTKEYFRHFVPMNNKIKLKMDKFLEKYEQPVQVGNCQQEPRLIRSCCSTVNLQCLLHLPAQLFQLQLLHASSAHQKGGRSEEYDILPMQEYFLEICYDIFAYFPLPRIQLYGYLFEQIWQVVSRQFSLCHGCVYLLQIQEHHDLLLALRQDAVTSLKVSSA